MRHSKEADMCDRLPSPETCMSCTELCQRRFPLIGTSRVMRACTVCGEMFITTPKSPRNHCSRQCYYRAKRDAARKRKSQESYLQHHAERWDAIMSDKEAWTRLRKLMLGVYGE